MRLDLQPLAHGSRPARAWPGELSFVWGDVDSFKTAEKIPLDYACVEHLRHFMIFRQILLSKPPAKWLLGNCRVPADGRLGSPRLHGQKELVGGG